VTEFAVRMMPGQTPYASHEIGRLHQWIRDAADGDPGEGGEPIRTLGHGDTCDDAGSPRPRGDVAPWTYLVFAGDQYYPKAGVRDLRTVTTDEHLALDRALHRTASDWVHVVRVKGGVVEEYNERQAWVPVTPPGF
jgi:hypothetical protein